MHFPPQLPHNLPCHFTQPLNLRRRQLLPLPQRQHLTPIPRPQPNHQLLLRHPQTRQTLQRHIPRLPRQNLTHNSTQRPHIIRRLLLRLLSLSLLLAKKLTEQTHTQLPDKPTLNILASP
ncbi:MAG: hypothetical protein ACPGVO_11365 [Spirulinaceae cyanobacterium]